LNVKVLADILLECRSLVAVLGSIARMEKATLIRSPPELGF
jgi:hypothetical protein